MNFKPLNIDGLIAKYPIVQGGMGVGISLDKLAGNVALCGGVGIISTAQIGFKEPGYDKAPLETNLKAIKKYIDRAKEIAKGGVVGVNIMVATKHYEEYVKAAVKAGIDLIVSGAGLPTKLPELVKNTKTKIAPIVSSVKSAKVICKLWDRHYGKSPDMVVIEGPKAGGHLGFTKDEVENITDEQYDNEIVAIKEVVDEYSKKYNKHIPVIFGGGVYDKADVEHYMGLGIDGVQMATRFVTTYECDATDEYKQAYLDATEEDIHIVKSPVGMPGRAIRNPFIAKTQEGPIKPTKCRQCLATCTSKDIPYCIADALLNAADGNVDDALIFCGAKAYKSTKLEHVSDIFDEILS
ncbi:MAG: nitronate monooxygenase [Lachnospiraceae bacterium]|nr:nitronate monooxygenase [Lachnospiraceae bacterium]